MNTTESILTGTARRRELFERYLEPNEAGLPDGCLVAEEGTSDALCGVVSDGKFSYKCGTTAYVCCEQKQGQQIDTGSIAGNCTRNDQSQDPMFDPTVQSIDATVERTGCGRWGLEAEQGAKCLLVLLTVTGPNEVDLLVYQQEIEASVNDGSFNAAIIAQGVPAVVIQIPETAAPTITPGNTTAPSSAPSVSPTAKPTKGVDPCPKLTGDCESCVTNQECLWCPGNGVCFNSDPDKRVSTSGDKVSRFLEVLEEECSGLASGSIDVCDATKPSVPPTLSPTVVPSAGSGGRFKWTYWNLSVSVLASGILLHLA